MMKMKLGATLVAGLWLTTTSVAAQTAIEQDKVTQEQDNKEASSVVITATRNEKAVDKIPGAISVISQRELEAQYQLGDDPSAALAMHVPGYAPSRQKMSSTGESLRGRAPLILFDGVPQSNPLRAGMREGYFADTAIIERIEVINGASAIQGMGATGGIINYISKTPRKEGSTHTLSMRLSTQFKDDSFNWKTGYTLAHKSGDLDLLGFVSVQARGIAYDGDGRKQGIETIQGDTMDSRGGDVFLKVGKTLDNQRVQFSFKQFRLEGNGDYAPVNANFVAGIPTTAMQGTPIGMPPRNQVRTVSADYQHFAMAGGALNLQLFKQDFASLYGATNTATFQDIRLAPKGTLYDQSEIIADKYGAKLTFVRPDSLISGLELTGGLDLLRDSTKQHLAATGRTWVPALDFSSLAPFAQFEYSSGALTVRGGLRHESARLSVDTYTTLAAYGSRTVQGGERSFAKNVKNLGAIWRVAPGWSAFVSSSEGFGLPDVGLVLRAVKVAGQSVDQLFDLQPVITRNNEIGVNWRGAQGSIGTSYYDSRSDLGTVLRINSAGLGVLDRVPTHVRGWEIAAELRVTPALSAFANYAKTRGKTATTADAPLDLDLGARSQGPDKAVIGATWRIAPTKSLRIQAMHLADRDINPGRKVGTSNLEEHFRGYTLLDLVGSWESPYGKLSLGIDNLLNRQYIGYYSQSVSIKEASAYFAGRGRSFSLGFSRTF